MKPPKPSLLVKLIYGEIFLPRYLPDPRNQAVSFLAEGKPTDRQETRCAAFGRLLHAIMCMPEYQLC